VTTTILAIVILALGVAGLLWRLRDLLSRELQLAQTVDVQQRRIEQLEQELAAAHQESARLASVDAVTGAATRRHFEKTLELEWRRARRTSSTLGVCIISLEGSFSHTTATDREHLMRRVAAIIAASLHRAGDLVARYDEDRFAAILAATDEIGVARVGSNVCSAIEQLAASEPQFGSLRVKIGTAASTRAEITDPVTHLMSRAEESLLKVQQLEATPEAGARR
jgi:diguanylate cyclase (GGDEF)-like protein